MTNSLWTSLAKQFSAALSLLVWASAGNAACPGRTQLEMNECAAATFQSADAELNAIWPAAKGRADALGSGAILLDAQRKWIAFRDAACSAEMAPYQGGSIQPLIWYSCLTRLTQARIQDLRIVAGN